MYPTKFTEEYGHTYDFEGPERDDRMGNDVSYLLRIYDKDKKKVHSEYVSYPSVPNYDQLQKDMLVKAEEIIDDIRPRTQEEMDAMFKKIRDTINKPKNESFKEYLTRSTLTPRKY